MNMYQLTVLLCGLTICLPFTGSAQKAELLRSPERGFISSEAGQTWEEGLLCGNGTIGANIFGQPLDETVIFTHERLFLPKGAPHMPPDNGDRLFEIRRLIDRGLYKQAAELGFQLSEQEGFMYPDPFVPAFDLEIEMLESGSTSDYMRSVDFETGEATVQWKGAAGVYRRRMFVSRADGVAVMLIQGPGQGNLNCRLRLKTREPSKKLPAEKREKSAQIFKNHVEDIEIAAEDNAMTFRNSYSKAYPGSIHALEGLLSVSADNGEVSAESTSLLVEDADQVLVFVDLAPIYDPERSIIAEMQSAIDGMPKEYGELRGRHARLHGELFNRMSLDVGGDADRSLTSEELLDKTSNEKLNKALIETEFDAGRYNIISSTGELPPTLQGLWGGTYAPSWASDFTQNGNVPSAIASLLSGNTPELMLAYTSYIEELVPYMRINAQNIFGARGIVLPSRTSTHGFNNALNPRFAGGFWVAGAPWAAHFFYDYYLYTGDREFLSEHALPFMEEVALFFEDYLYEGPDGKYIFSPTQSPENTPGNTDSQATFNATMAVASAKELLRNTIAASELLDTNEEKIPHWRAMLAKMPEYMISEEGTVKEWLTPKLKERLSHRHSSQLYPLYDGMPAEIAEDEQLQAAFERIIEIKLDRHWADNTRGFMSFGLVQLGQAATSLGENKLAYQCLVPLVNRYWLNNLASMHNHKSLLNMDISGGMPAVIIKMLAASQPGRISLLPAVPAEWPNGSVEGILCRAGIEIAEMEWSPGEISVTLHSTQRQTIQLEAPGNIENITVASGDVAVKSGEDDNTRSILLPADQDAVLEIEYNME